MKLNVDVCSIVKIILKFQFKLNTELRLSLAIESFLSPKIDLRLFSEDPKILSLRPSRLLAFVN